MKNIYFLFVLALISIPVFGQEKPQEVFYILPDQQIVNVKQFEPVAQSIDEQGGKIKLLDTIHKNGNLFINITVKPKHNKRSPYYKFEEQIGEKFPLEKFGLKTNGKPILVNFWFTTCPPCIKEIPDLNNLKETFEDKVDFYAITFNSKEQVEKFEKKRPVHFTHITNQRKALTDFGVRSYPMNMILDKDGKIRFVSGMVGYDLMEFKYELNKLLLN